ncbi:MAG: hypothetical protein ACU833_00435 [Gammaproteobacteria bacterium]
MNSIYSPNKTSARLLVDFARQDWEVDERDNSENRQRYLMLYDVFIKARSCALINKTAFWLSVVSGLLVLLWPSIATITRDFGFEKELFKSAIVQTTVTGLAALNFAVYSHYKKRQMHLENLMRYLIFSKDSIAELTDKILREIERIDTGFSFSDAVAGKPEIKDAESRPE